MLPEQLKKLWEPPLNDTTFDDVSQSQQINRKRKTKLFNHPPHSSISSLPQSVAGTCRQKESPQPWVPPVCAQFEARAVLRIPFWVPFLCRYHCHTHLSLGYFGFLKPCGQLQETKGHGQTDGLEWSFEEGSGRAWILDDLDV